MKQKMHYYLMISCPGDVIKERELLKKCVEAINKERDDDWVELQYWVTDTFSDAGTEAQASINEQLVKDSDGLIAIFNARLGTPTREYKCGTDEEIALMLKANKHVSLLFNNKPTIDLTNPSSIEQITNLQIYKEEQSKKAYYRVFNDDDSFMNLAMQEIRMWLREITKTTKESYAIAKDISAKTEDVESHSDAETIDKPPTEPKSTTSVVPANNNDIDNEAGLVDCVMYIADAANVMVEEINSFHGCTNDLTEKTNAFTHKLQYLKNQKNGTAGVLMLFKQFATEINTNKEALSSTLDRIENKWNEIYKYLLICNKYELTNEDRIIVISSISGLKECFENALHTMDELIDTFITTPNYQKELKKSANGLADVFKRFKVFTLKAIDNCEEIETSFSVIA